jgi:hypothetical protein
MNEVELGRFPISETFRQHNKLLTIAELSATYAILVPQNTSTDTDKRSEIQLQIGYQTPMNQT